MFELGGLGICLGGCVGRQVTLLSLMAGDIPYSSKLGFLNSYRFNFLKSDTVCADT